MSILRFAPWIVDIEFACSHAFKCSVMMYLAQVRLGIMAIVARGGRII